MKKKILIGLISLILVIGIIVFIILLNSNKENLYINIDEYYNKQVGIYEKIENNNLYVIVVYQAVADEKINNLTVIANENGKVVEKIKTHSNTRNLKKGEKGYFVAKSKKLKELNKYTYYVDLGETNESIHDNNSKPVIQIDKKGYVATVYKNGTDKEVEIVDCKIILRDKNNKEVDIVDATPSKNNIGPYEEIPCFGKTEKDKDSIDLTKSELKVNLKED